MKFLTRIYALRLALALVAIAPIGMLVRDALAVDGTVGAEEKVAFASSAVQEMRDAEKTIAKLLEQMNAKKDADPDGVACVNNRLTSIRALLTVSEAAKTSMQEAITTNDDETAEHEYRKITVAVSKTRVLLAEAQQCASGNQLESGTTLVDWESALGDEADSEEIVIDDFDLDPQPPQITHFK